MSPSTLSPTFFAQTPDAMQDPVRVLVVEDEVIVAMELQHHLERLGYDVLDAVTTGEAAVEQARALRPDLVLMDVRLEGELDGIEAAERIRARQPLPVIFLTAFGDEATLERAKATAPYGYVLKPFDEQGLFATIEVALHQHRLERRLQRSHDDLRHILDGLRAGTVMTDDGGRISFVSAAAQRLLGLDDDLAGRPWEAAFPLPEPMLARLRHMAEQPADGRQKVSVRVEHGGGAQFWMEVDVRDDPRSAGRRLFVLYDVTEVYGLRRLLDDQASFHDLIGRSPAMQEVFRQIEQVAAVDSTVLVEGETGTGKELVARAIHDAGRRRKGPFVAVNCAALPDDLAASQLFGYKKGAFTGAIADHKGFFEAAHGGTLFLDEIGDVPPEVQVNLLRVLEQRAVTRVGETKPRPVDVRIVTATHQNLMRAIERGRFRADLLYRIRVARVTLPALRQRREDVPLLVRAFLQQCRATTGKAVAETSHEAMRRLLDYGWPGNVRELRNAVEFAVIRARGPIIQEDDLPPEVREAGRPPLALADADGAGDEESRIRAALAQTGDNRKEAAKLLGVSRATFYRRLIEYGID